MVKILGRLAGWKKGARIAGRSWVVAAVVAVLGASADGGVTTVFLDDFEAYTVGNNPGTPPIGQPWQVSEAASDGIQVVNDGLSNVLQFGRYYNTVIAPISAADQLLIEANKNVGVSLQYRSISAGGRIPFFDISAVNTTLGKPAFLVRVMPQPNVGNLTLHDIYFLHPTKGLIDSGLDIASDSPQNVSLAADFTSSSLQLSVGAKSVTLPLFSCPSMIHDARLSSYMIVSGTLTYTDVDNVKVTTHAPEPATLCLLAAGVLACALVRAVAVVRKRS